jgi:hypothetical protein
VGEPVGSRQFGLSRRRWKDYMRMGVKGSAKAEGYTLLPRDRGKWLTLLKAQMNLRVPWNARYFLSSRASQDGLCSRALNLKLAMSLAKHVMFICRNE